MGCPRLPRLELREMGRRQYVYAVKDEGPGQGRLVLTSQPSVPAKSAAGKRPLAPRGRRLLAYERVPGHVRFFLDRAIYQDTARALLPEIGAFGAGLIDHLLRGEIAIKVETKAVETPAANAEAAPDGGQTVATSEATTGTTPDGGAKPVAMPAKAQPPGDMVAQISITGARGTLHDGQLRVFADDRAGVRKPIGSWPASALAAGQTISVAVPAGTRLVAAVLRGEDDAGVLVAAGEQPTLGN